VPASSTARRPRFTFGKDSRLLTSHQYQAVFTQVDTKVACPQFLLLAHHNEAGKARLGLVVAKKHLKLATDRNRVKRLIRESFRLHRGALPPMDIIVMTRPEIGLEQQQDLASILVKQWQRLSKRASEQHQAG
jgi:ribonuclease P protein component